jgi:SNF2-related domain
VYERGQRVALRDHHWEITDVRSAHGGALLELRRISEGAGAARTLTVAPALEASLQIAPAQPLRFGIGNPIRLQQLHDALSLTMAHGRGDLVALQHGRIELEAYQLVPVLKALRLPRARLLIADDVGLGKTIEAGLVLLELARRGRASRVLVACPAALTDQWVDEMAFRFNLEFTKVDGEKWQQLRRENPASHSPWAAVPLAVSSIDYLKANTGALHQAPPFDLVIVDEAHHVARRSPGRGAPRPPSARGWPGCSPDAAASCCCCRPPRTTAIPRASLASSSSSSRTWPPTTAGSTRRSSSRTWCGA